MGNTKLSSEAVRERDSRQATRSTEHLIVTGSAVLGASLVGNGLNYLFGVFLARWLGAEQFGLYAIGLTFFSALVLVVPLGMEAGAIKFISERRERQDPCGINAIVGQAAVVTFSTSIVAAACLALLAPIISERLYHKPDLQTVLWLFSLAVPFSAITGVLLAALRAHHTVRPLVMVRYLWEPVGKFVLAGGFLGWGWGLVGVVGGIVAVLAMSLLLSMGFLRTVVPLSLKSLVQWTPAGASPLLKYCLPLAVAALFGVVTPRMDIFMLGSWASAKEIGVYQAAFQTASALALILGALESSLTPFFGQNHAHQDIGGLQHLYQTASKLVAMCTVPLFVILAVFSREVLSLFGPEFVAGWPLLIILAAGQLVSSTGGSPNNLLLMGGHSRLVMWNTVGIGTVSILVFAVAVPWWGVWGAAYGAAATQVLMMGLRIIQVWRLYRIQPFTQHLGKPIVAGVLSGALAVTLKSTVPVLPWPLLAIVTGLVYVAILLALKLEAQERAAFSAIVSKVRMLVAARA